MRRTRVLVAAFAVSAAAWSPGCPASAQPADPAPEAVAACSEFARALDLAALSYSDFANALALGEARPDYADPIVSSSNAYGRTGLREAVGVAMSAAGTPGLAPQIAAPMRAWALGATKLIVLMGLRVGVDRFNANATAINDHTEAVQQACADAGTRA